MLISIFLPGVRWFVRRRLNRAIERINSSLRIQIRPFQRTRRQVLIDRLSYDTQVIAEIEKLATDSDVPRRALQKKVRTYAREIVPSFNAYMYYRLGYWLARQISRFIYRVKVGAADIDKLRQIDPQSTVVFVMNHRSNMDYLLVTYLAANQATLSYAVGEWARVLPLNLVVKGLGGYFVRRESNNPLYRKVLERYIHMSTHEGVCQAVYLEGGLSRDGNFGRPKLGFLDYMLRSFDADTDRDIVFIPIGINYDHVLEDLNMLAWTDPHSKRKGLAFHLRNVARFLRFNLFVGGDARFRRNGYASVNFGIPVSAKEFSSAKRIQFKRLSKEQRFEQVAALADTLMDGIRHVIPILPVPLIATVFVRNPQTGLRSIDLIVEVDRLIDELVHGGAPMREEEKPRNSTLLQSLQLLQRRGVLIEDDDRYFAAPEFLALLNYYANSIAHWLVVVGEDGGEGSGTAMRVSRTG
ncbi:MAG: 1-acyl-sn-glycerol-3-phosphate acyltransferase [Lysobacteraceae bacterium]